MRKNLQCILPSERSRSENATSCKIPTTRSSGKGKTRERVKRSGCQRLEGREDEQRGGA